MNSKMFPVLVAALIVVAGCASPKSGAVPFPNPRALSGEQREWSNVYSVEYVGDKKVRTPIGYVYRKWDENDPRKGGDYIVKNLEQEDVGFITAENNRGYVWNGKPPSVDLQTSDVVSGVKKILQAPGAIEIEKVTSVSTPAPAPAKTK